jgi:hypothetical protein
LAISLQSTITTFYTKLSKSIEEAWRDRKTILVEVVESGGMGLNGDLEKAREVVMPVVSAWKGLGVLARWSYSKRFWLCPRLSHMLFMVRYPAYIFRRCILLSLVQVVNAADTVAELVPLCALVKAGWMETIVLAPKARLWFIAGATFRDRLIIQWDVKCILPIWRFVSYIPGKPDMICNVNSSPKGGRFGISPSVRKIKRYKISAQRID